MTPIGTKYSQAYIYDSSLERYSSIGTVYKAGSDKTYYQGNGSYVYGRGSSVDAIEYDGTLYEAGSSVTPVGIKVSGLYKADDNENWSYTPIGSSYSDLYQRNAEDDTTVTTIGNKCSLKPATVTTMDVTALTV